jgi:hypothetical protein
MKGTADKLMQFLLSILSLTPKLGTRLLIRKGYDDIATNSSRICVLFWVEGQYGV